ncbi:MAG: alanine dehydrogenase [Bacteroidales bacterium]
MSDIKGSSVRFSFLREGLMPQEEKLEVATRQRKLVIGVPKEMEKHENRVPLTPEAVEILTGNGHDLYIEKDAGKGANYTDSDYSERGGTIIDNREKIFQSDVILKVAPLTPQEILLLKGKQTIMSSLHLNNQTRECILGMMQKRITAVAFENIKDEYNTYPVARMMSTIAGTTAILVAGELLSNEHGGKGVLLGGITGISPTDVVILGSGTVAEYAARAAMGLGASVKIFDHSLNNLRRLQNNLRFPVYTSIFHPHVFEKALRSADVLIGAVNLREKGPRYLVTEEMVKIMKKGTVIIDVSIDQGGCIETSECRSQNDPVYVKHGIIHYCVPNLASRVSRTASIALSNVFLPLLLEMGENSTTDHMSRVNTGFRHGIYIFNGIMTNKFMGEHFGIPYQDINLLMAAF